MSSQFTAANLGPGYARMEVERKKQAQEKASKRMREAALQSVMQAFRTGERPPPAEEMLIRKEQEDRLREAQKEAIADSQSPIYGAKEAESARQQAKRMQKEGLRPFTRAMSPETLREMQLNAAQRVLNAEKRAVQGGAALSRQKLLVRLVSRLSIGDFDTHLRQHILHDQRARGDLALLWLQELFIVQDTNDNDYHTYDQCLCRFLNELYQKGDHKESLFHKLLLEAPMLTENALTILKQACMDEIYGTFGINTLREIILTRPRQRQQLAALLIAFTCSERADLREQALNSTRELYALPTCRSHLRTLIVHYALMLAEEHPPKELFGNDMFRFGESNGLRFLFILPTIRPHDPILIDVLRLYFSL